MAVIVLFHAALGNLVQGLAPATPPTVLPDNFDRHDRERPGHLICDGTGGGDLHIVPTVQSALRRCSKRVARTRTSTACRGRAREWQTRYVGATIRMPIERNASCELIDGPSKITHR